MKTCFTFIVQALVLRDYEDYIPPQQIYSLLALSSAVCQSFGWSSKAFIRLESMDGVNKKERQQYENTALEIFTRRVYSELISGVCIEVIYYLCICCNICTHWTTVNNSLVHFRYYSNSKKV